jgi:hypothetical protein
MPTPFQPYKPTDSKSLLSNPFAENQIGGSSFGVKPVGDSGILIKTKDPIVTTKKPFTFTNPSQSQWDARKKLNENLIKTKEDAEKSWWQKQTKTAKTIYVSVGVLAVGLIGYYAYKKFGKNN